MASIEVVATKGTAVKGMFMEWRNTTKSLHSIFDKGIAKICKKLKFHDEIKLHNYLQDWTANLKQCFAILGKFYVFAIFLQ